MPTSIMDLKPYIPQLSLAERDRRWRATRQRMEADEIDCLIVWGNTISQGLGMTNVRYLTQVGSWHGGIALFPLEGEVTLFSAPPHMSLPYNGYLAAQDWIADIRPYSMRAIVEELKARRLERGRLGVVSYGNVVAGNNLTYYDYLALREGLPQATFVDTSEMVEGLRRIKSPEEITMLEKSGAIGRKVVHTLIETAAPGVRENELYAEMIRTQLIEGAEPNIFILMSSGPIAGGGVMQRRLTHGNDQPLCPTSRKLENGDIVICEFHVSYAGYLSAVEFTVAVGEPPRELKELHAVAVECLQAGIEQFRPGASVRQVAAAMREPVLGRGLDYLELGFHNHGLSSADFPTIVYKPGWGRMAFDDLPDFALDEDMIFGTNIDIQNPRWKSDVGVMFGDTIHVTPSGGRRLVGIPLNLPVK